MSLIAESEEQKTTHKNDEKRNVRIDFKMITFKLCDKDYGIDIMKVKEISKINKFTYVPNVPSFVRGVYNLRGDIITVIDLRIMFNLPAKEIRESETENVIILRFEDRIIGVIVDKIEKVVGVASSTIKPPHPLFGDINIRYISGIIEFDSALYIVLDIEKVLGKETEKKTEKAAEEIQEDKTAQEVDLPAAEKNVELRFMAEALAAQKHFYAGQMNGDWVIARMEVWKKERKQQGLNVQIRGMEDANEFLFGFSSPCYASFWDNKIADEFRNVISRLKPGSIFQAWDIGCNDGRETYSMAALIKKQFSDKQVKVWANDNDLLKISMAPNLTPSEREIPDYLKEWIVKNASSIVLKPEIKSMILFEYHDVLNKNPFSNLDVVFVRDFLSFLVPQEQEKLLLDIDEKLNKGGILILGSHEKINREGYSLIHEGSFNAYLKEIQ